MIRLAFALAVLGFGTKMGLFPVHTWLPDAHSEAPTPVSALLSGSLLAVSFYAILRYYQVATAAVGPRFPRDTLLVFGIASLLLAALYLLDQHDVKRMLAYSSVEHMGILAIGVGFGAPIALAGVLLHVLAHAAAKGNAFMGAGVLVHKFGSKRISAISGGLDLLPWSGPLFLIAVLALGAMPPFGIFRSEFEIVEGGFGASSNAAAAVLIILVTVAFLGLSVAANRMLLTPRGVPGGRPPGPAPQSDDGWHAGGPGGRPPGLQRSEPSSWMVVPVIAGVAALLVLGVHPPAELTGLLDPGRAPAGRWRVSPAPRDGLDTRLAGDVPVLWDELAGEVAAGGGSPGCSAPRGPRACCCPRMSWERMTSPCWRRFCPPRPPATRR